MKFMLNSKPIIMRITMVFLFIGSLYILKYFNLLPINIGVIILGICFYILGQYVIFNKLFSRYFFYFDHKKTINGLVISSPALYYILSPLLICLYHSCGELPIRPFMNMIMIFIVTLLMSLTYFTIEAYDYFIGKTDNILKKSIDVVAVLMALAIFFSLMRLVF